MKLLTAEKDGEYIVQITGEIDHHSTPGIREEIDAALEQKHPKCLILDLGATSFMDSSGLGLILGRLRKSREIGAELILANPSASVLKILTLAGVEKLMTIRYL